MTAETLEPLRDNNIKPAYPFSIDLPGYAGQKSNKSVWIQTFGSSANQKTTSDSNGYSAHSGGFSIGADFKVDARNIVGISGGVSQSNIKSTGSSKNLMIEAYQFTLYRGFTSKSFFINSTAGFALNNYASNRYISVGNARAKAQYRGYSYMGTAEIGKNYKFRHNVTFTPSFMITAAHNEVNNYQEDGAGTLNLNVKNSSSNFLEARLGAELSRLYTTKNETKVRPQFSVSFGYDFIGDEQKTTSNLCGC